MDVVVSQLSDLTMPPSYDQVVNHQNKFLKVSGANKVDVPHPQYPTLTVNDDNDVLICWHRNFKRIKNGMLTSHPHSIHFMSLTTTHQYCRLHK